MKKTVIIAIFIVYLASIVLVQIFGVPVTVPQGGAYIDGIEITGIELTNPAIGQDTTIRENDASDKKMYGFSYVDGEYNKDTESLANNPNRVKIHIVLHPDDANKGYLEYAILAPSENDYYLSKETDEIIFLNKVRLEITLKENRANMDVRKTIVIRAL